MSDLMRKGAMAAIEAEIEQLRFVRDNTEMMLNKLDIQLAGLCKCELDAQEEMKTAGLTPKTVPRYFVPMHEAATAHMHDVLWPAIETSHRMQTRTENGPYVGRGSALDSKSTPE